MRWSTHSRAHCTANGDADARAHGSPHPAADADTTADITPVDSSHAQPHSNANGRATRPPLAGAHVSHCAANRRPNRASHAFTNANHVADAHSDARANDGSAVDISHRESHACDNTRAVKCTHTGTYAGHRTANGRPDDANRVAHCHSDVNIARAHFDANNGVAHTKV